jgi:hypothetical protein
MTKVSFEDRQVRFSFENTQKLVAVTRVIAVIFLVIGLGMCFATYQVAKSELFHVYYQGDPSEDDRAEGKKKVAVIGLFAFCFTALPIFLLLKTRGNKQVKNLPNAFILEEDNQRFTVLENEGRSFSIPFAQIQAFFVRSYQVTYRGKNGSYQVNYFALCMKKKDGALWDLYSCRDQDEITGLLSELKKKITLREGENFVFPNSIDLPAKIRKEESLTRVYLEWNKSAKIVAQIITFVFLLGFFSVIYFIFSSILVIVFGCIFIGMVVFMVVIMNKDASLPINFLELAGTTLKYGRMNSKRTKTKIIQELPLSHLQKIRFNFLNESANIYQEDRVLSFYAKNSPGLDAEPELKPEERFLDNLKEQPGLIRLSIPQMSVIDMLALEAFLEKSLLKLGVRVE